MTDYEQMMMPKSEEIGFGNPNLTWSTNHLTSNNVNPEDGRYVMFDETNLLDFNESKYAVQQNTPRTNKRRSSPANLQSHQLQLGDIMQDLNIADAQVEQDFSADLMTNPVSATFNPGFLHKMPLKAEEMPQVQKFMDNWGPMISGAVANPQTGHAMPSFDNEFSRRHSIAVTGYEWRSNSPDFNVNNHTVEPKFIQCMSQIPCVLAPTTQDTTSTSFNQNSEQNLYQFPVHRVQGQDLHRMNSSASPSSDMMSSADSLTPTTQHISGQESTENSISNMSSEGYTNLSRKRSIVEELVDTPVMDMSFDMFQSPSVVSPQRKRTKSIDFGVLSYPEQIPEPEAYEYPLMTQEDIEKAETDQNARPRRQRIKYPGDCYTPKWVRYSGQAKEGYCDSCQPGKWLQLKNSAYWYHKQFFHGISSVSGRQFIDPIDQRWGDQDAIEGLCHQCRHWISICTSKRKNSVLWYRHAHKCHIYHKPKATQARRRPSVQF
ncbi:hypothetical protein NQZ79_g787 [Umbelopsis isabellina]|nr:hypothetical protein NQZ79_g787 [Umbelopsis isabellina]